MKQRIINTRFWEDDYTSNLDPIEKLLFLYLLTNSSTNISGIYEIPLKRVALDTGIDRDMVLKILERFKKDQKIFHVGGWICVKNFLKHQNIKSPTVIKGVNNELKAIPKDILEDFIRYGYGVQAISHLNLNLNLNLKEVLGSTSSQELTTTNNKDMNKYNESNFSDEGERIVDLDTGDVVDPQAKPKREPKNELANRIQNKFIELCEKNINTKPIKDWKGYLIVLYALNTGKLSEKQIYDLFDEWFSFGKDDTETIQITRALSGNQINAYKVRNNIR